ncbi:MAG TPA: Na+/H+ antiporter subunit E [Desulfomicrobiaceae bacterium]|nr:Na+/H+ antiporter subunit E [Desulfomicrobiaceae bacterium]
MSHLLRFMAVFATWLVLSGMYDAFHMTIGVFCSAFVTWLSADLFQGNMSLKVFPSILRLIIYIPWLVWEVAKANYAMLRIVFHPKLMDLINPRIVTFKTKLRSPMGLTLLANSITLTPGTITVSIDERGYVAVHAIDDEMASGVPGLMEEKITRIFEAD